MTSVQHRPSSWWTEDGVHVRSRGTGTGPPVVALHGIGGSSSTFDPLTSTLAERGYATHAWDAPGYGRSIDPAPDVDYVAHVHDIIEALDAGSVHLVGTSWGGVIGAQVALRHPQSVASLTLADSTRGSAVSLNQQQSMLQRIVELKEVGSERFAHRRAERLVAPDCNPATVATVRSTMAGIRVTGYSAAARMMAATDLSHRLWRLTPPTLVLVGEHDTVTGVEESRLLADVIPQAAFGLILNAGHYAVLEHPYPVAAHLRHFWEQVALRQAAPVSEPSRI